MMPFMTLDTAQIRQLRTARAWSQDHLATVSGLSLRTVQRVESVGTASPETCMALAGAFGITVTALMPSADASVPSPVDALPLAREQVPSPRRGLQYRLLRFFVLGSLLVALDVSVTGRVTWSAWALAFWGACLILRLARAHLLQPKTKHLN